jgi:hypothetical protein
MTDPRNPPAPPDAPKNTAGREPRKRAPRVAGPFEARRPGAIDLPLRIHDLSLGGCLIESFHEVPVGRRIQIEIDMAEEGWVMLHAEVLYLREAFGFAVKFVDVDETTRVKLARAVLQRLKEQKRAR